MLTDNNAKSAGRKAQSSAWYSRALIQEFFLPVSIVNESITAERPVPLHRKMARALASKLNPAFGTAGIDLRTSFTSVQCRFWVPLSAVRRQSIVVSPQSFVLCLKRPLLRVNSVSTLRSFIAIAHSAVKL